MYTKLSTFISNKLHNQPRLSALHLVTKSNEFFGPSGKLFNFGNEAFYKYVNSDETDIVYVKGKSHRRDDFRITIDIPN